MTSDQQEQQQTPDERRAGRGPTAARTNWAGPDALMTVLDDTLMRDICSALAVAVDCQA